MKAFKFLQYSFLVGLLSILFVSTTSAQWQKDPGGGGVADTDISTNIFRKASVAIAANNPFPSDIPLFVGGRIAQDFSGVFGGTGANDRWLALGGNFGTPNPTQTYGLIRQWNDVFHIAGVKDGTHAVNSWSNTGRMDFDWVDGGNINRTRMSLTFKGNLGIGTTAPPVRLTVVGNENNGNDGTLWIEDPNDYMIFDGNEQDAMKNPLFLNLNSGNDTYINAKSGNVGVGTTNTLGLKFYVRGKTGCTLGFWSVSDRRYKRDITQIDGAMDKIKALDGKTYKFKRGEINGVSFEEAGEDQQLGFIAQDLEKVFPELVHVDDAGYYAVNYTGLIPVLVEGMKEQENTIATQREEMEEMKTRIDRLEALINNMADQQGLNKKENPTTQSTAVLKQNAPNPFNNLTTIQYELPSNVSNASLVVYDFNGNTIRTFNIAGKGNVEFDASGLTNGTYIYSIIANGESIARQAMVVQK